MNIAFFGSPVIARKILYSIHKKFPVSLVITQPDKKVGRKQLLTPTPIGKYATDKNLELIKDTSITRIIDKFKTDKIDLAIVVAYGQLIPNKLLTIPTYGFVNIHYSLLPKYRGASPVQSAILNGDNKTGVTIMKMDKELDHGEIISQNKIGIGENDTTKSLLKKLTNASKLLLIEMITYIQKHDSLPTLIKQDHTKATYCNRISKQDGFVEFEYVQKALADDKDKAKTLHNKIRAYYPWPIVWTILPNEKRCKLISSTLLSSPTQIGDLGPVYRQSRDSCLRGNDKVYTSKLIITQIQLEGKKPTSDKNVINNYLKT